MKSQKNILIAVMMLVLAGSAAPTVMAQDQEVMTIQGQEIKAPVPTEPGIFTITGQFVRVSYNHEGWVTLGYRLANDSQGNEWMLLEAGMSLRKPTKNYTLKREAISVTLPDGTTVGLANQEEYLKAGYLRAMNMKGNTIRDSINYFPVQANQSCRIGFFSDPTNQAATLAYDQVELSWQRACLGRLFFKLPEGQKIVTGQYWINTKFAGSTVQTPFRIMTKDEEKFFKKNWKDVKKEHEAFLKQEAEKAKQQ